MAGVAIGKVTGVVQNKNGSFKEGKLDGTFIWNWNLKIEDRPLSVNERPISLSLSAKTWLSEKL